MRPVATSAGRKASIHRLSGNRSAVSGAIIRTRDLYEDIPDEFWNDGTFLGL